MIELAWYHYVGLLLAIIIVVRGLKFAKHFVGRGEEIPYSDEPEEIDPLSVSILFSNKD